jgi:hypothetical protein
MANVMNWIILSIFAVIIIYFFVSTAYTIASPNVPCEDINFAANYTYYNTANTPIVALNGIYDDSGCANAFPVSRIEEAANYSLRLNTNGTTAYPNITTGHHYVNYDYEHSATVWGLNLGFIGVLVVIGVGIVIVGKLITNKK